MYIPNTVKIMTVDIQASQLKDRVTIVWYWQRYIDKSKPTGYFKE